MPFLPDGLVWLASFPKSGNTWMRALLSNVVNEGDGPRDINNLVMHGISSARAPLENRLLVDSTLLTQDESERFRALFHDDGLLPETPAGWVKTHDAFTYLPDGAPLLGRAARGALYVVRDPRDVAVSASFHNSLEMVRITQHMNDPEAALPSSPFQFRQKLAGWSGHVRSWLDQRDVPVHLVRYEDLLADTGTTLRGVTDFLGMACSDADIERAVRHASFDELQRQERERGFRERDEKRSIFFREGRAGAWRERLPPELARSLEEAHGETMKRLGYKLEMVESAA